MSRVQQKQLQARGPGATTQWRSPSTSTPSPNDSFLRDALLKEFYIIPTSPLPETHASCRSQQLKRPLCPHSHRPEEETAPKEASHVHMVDLI